MMKQNYHSKLLNSFNIFYLNVNELIVIKSYQANKVIIMLYRLLILGAKFIFCTNFVD